LGLLSSTLLVVFFSETMLLPAIPEIMKDLQVPYPIAAWIFSGYMIIAVEIPIELFQPGVIAVVRPGRTKSL
jgi:hypothetical protein